MVKYNGIITKKIEVIEERISKINSLLPLTLEQLQDDYFLRSGIERTLQVCIEAIIDISERIISLENSSPVSTSYKALERLENLGIIKDSSKYKQMIQFRNLFENESVDTQKMIFVIDNYFNVFEDYINEIK